MKRYLNIHHISIHTKALILALAFGIFILSFHSASANTGINQQIPYSGTLVNNSGIALPGPTYRAKIVLWDALTGGTQLYEEIRDGITVYPGTGVSPALPVADGQFEILIGSQNTTNFAAILNNDTLYLELQLDMDNNGSYEEVFAPRRRLGSAVSAINSLRLVANGGTDTDTLSLDVSGNVIATSLGGVANVSPGIGFDRVLLANSSGQFSQVDISSLGGGGAGWGLLGNAITSSADNIGVAGTGSFIGSTTAQSLQFVTNNLVRAVITSSGDLLTGSNVIIGNGDTSATPANASIRGTNGNGTNITGSSLTLTGGRGTGTGAGGDLIFATAPAGGASGSSLNNAVERLRINSTGNIIAPILGGTANGSTPGGFDRVVLANSSGQLNQVNISVLGGGGGSILLTPQSTPANPGSGALVYSETLVGRDLPFYLTQSGRKKAIGQAWYGNPVPLQIGVSSGTNAPISQGGTLTTAATMSSQITIGSANRYTSMFRKRYATSTANTTTGIRQADAQFYSGNAAGYGGVFFSARFGVATNKLASVFVGLTNSTAALGGNASALTNMIGMGYDVTDATTGNWFLMKNNGAGTAQKIDLLATNAARGANIGFELNMYNPPNSTDWYVYIVNLNTGAVVLNTSYIADAEVPVVNTGLSLKAEVRNDANATQCDIEHNYIYVEPQGW